jgi:hypothetical protein
MPCQMSFLMILSTMAGSSVLMEQILASVLILVDVRRNPGDDDYSDDDKKPHDRVNHLDPASAVYLHLIIDLSCK